MPKSITGDRTKVSIREEVFARQFLILSLNATRAAVAAGYSRSSAGSKAQQLLKKDNVKALIRTLAAENSKKLDFSVKKTLEQIARHALTDRRVLFNSDGTPKKISELSEAEAVCIEAVEYSGKRIKRVKFTDPLRALDMLARFHKLFLEDVTTQDTGIRVIVVDAPRPPRLVGSGPATASNGNGHNGNGNGHSNGHKPDLDD